ncbi:MAG: PIN domain-containing protein [Candidatus Daviesbacteria bacterium]|nr:PIN domain-containing protein [Candidatus Daviesbacteria bacterium]
MAKIFLDANVFIDIIEERKNINLDQFGNDDLFISPLSVHILTYLYKYKIPHKKLSDSIEKYLTLIPLNNLIAYQALLGPTTDFEDNVQLYSAAEAECDFFLTEDKKLLNMKFFGKVQIKPSLSSVRQ